MPETGTGPFEFDDWEELARSDPESFEARRREALEQLLARLPEDRRDRLRRFQWLIDQERELAKTPLGACVRLTEMLNEGIHGPGGLRDRLDEVASVVRGDLPPSEPEPEILDFPSPPRPDDQD